MFSEERGVLGAVCEGKGEISFIFSIFFVRGKRIWVQSGKEWDFVVFEGELGCKGFF